MVDTGYGIETGSIPHIFGRYYQVQGEHQASGSGIGLAIVRNLVELHEAEISVDSQPGEGTVFRIRLITDNTYPEAMRTKAREAGHEEQPVDSQSIMLVVEDNADIRQYVSETFSEEFEVLAAANGRDGLEVAFARIPDIIISDIMMPVMDGTEFCKKVKEDLRTSHIPFILLTAKDTMLDKTEGYTAGADSYITKPFSGSLLRSRVYKYLESRKRIAAQFKESIHPQQTLADLIPLDNEFILKITAYVEERINDENINIHPPRQRIHEPFHPYRKIKALTGLSTNEFIRKVPLPMPESSCHQEIQYIRSDVHGRHQQFHLFP